MKKGTTDLWFSRFLNRLRESEGFEANRRVADPVHICRDPDSRRLTGKLGGCSSNGNAAC